MWTDRFAFDEEAEYRESDFSTDVAADAEGNSYITGTVELYVVYLRKYDQSGEEEQLLRKYGRDPN